MNKVMTKALPENLDELIIVLFTCVPAGPNFKEDAAVIIQEYIRHYASQAVVDSQGNQEAQDALKKLYNRLTTRGV